MPDEDRPMTLREYLESIRSFPSPDWYRDHVGKQVNLFIERCFRSGLKPYEHHLHPLKEIEENGVVFFVGYSDFGLLKKGETDLVNYARGDIAKRHLPREIYDAGRLGPFRDIEDETSLHTSAFMRAANVLEAIEHYRTREHIPAIVRVEKPAEPVLPEKGKAGPGEDKHKEKPAVDPRLADVDHIVKRFAGLDLD